MEIIYNWIISAMDEYPKTSDDLIDVVFVVHWRRNATTTVNEIVYFTDTFNLLNVPAPSPEDFTPYEDLTFEQVCGWLEAGLDVASIDASLALNLEAQINPTVISLPLPWLPTPMSSTPIVEEVVA